MFTTRKHMQQPGSRQKLHIKRPSIQPNLAGSFSSSNKASYLRISQSFKATSFKFRFDWLFWYFTNILAIVLLSLLQNLKMIQLFKVSIFAALRQKMKYLLGYWNRPPVSFSVPPVGCNPQVYMCAAGVCNLKKIKLYENHDNKISFYWNYLCEILLNIWSDIPIITTNILYVLSKCNELWILICFVDSYKFITKIKLYIREKYRPIYTDGSQNSLAHRHIDWLLSAKASYFTD